MDERLIAEAGKGNQNALARLLYENYEIVFKYLIKFTLNKNIAEDMTQETMVKAIEKFSLYNSQKAKFSTWLISIAQNIYIDYLRKIKREKKYIEEDCLKLEMREPFDEHDDSWDRVMDVLAQLPEESRFPLILKHYYGYSLEEIASLMSIPLGTVKSRIHNAVKTVRKELE